jgi:hypothetical protein
MTTWSEHNPPRPCERCGTHTQARDAKDRPIHDSCEREALLEERGLLEALTEPPWGVS